MAASSPEAGKHVDDYVQSCKSPLRLLNTPEDFRSAMAPGILTGTFPNWKGFVRESGAGWVFARGAMEAAYYEASRLGVRFVTGESAGKVVKLIYSSPSATSSSDVDVLGATTAGGTEHRADRTILCAGANSDRLFDFERQLRPTAWTLAHIQMSDAERAKWKDLPVLFNVERGFFMV